MSFEQITVYAVLCDRDGCGNALTFHDDEQDTEVEVRLDVPVIDEATRLLMADQGWLLWPSVVCPGCVHRESDAVLAASGLQVEGGPLPGGEAP